MRWPELPLLLIASLGLSGCVDSLQSQPAATKVTAGFWFWQGSSTDATGSSEPLDVLFLHVGTISKDSTGWHVYGELPKEIPAAREYWLVWRYERQGVPDLAAASIVAREAAQLRDAAPKRHLNIVGVQLDIDSPTGSLSQYANSLREVRKDLPPGLKISITALLDWFRAGTAIGDVIKEVDEFVPQFYDVGDYGSEDGAIAAKIDSARWGPVFNRFGKRFRVGISTFGRARLVPKEGAPRSRYYGVQFFHDLKPLDIALNSAFQLQTTRSPAGELVLSYQATRKNRISYNDFEPGDTIQFILSTPDAIRDAMESVKRIGGHLAGVLFFRWPTSNETLAMPPDEVLAAAGFTTRARRTGSSIFVSDGGCAAVKCVDLYLENANPYSPKLVRYRIHGSTALEYFLPEANMPVRMVGDSDLELSLPPYCGRSLMHIGRAVTAHPAQFTVDEEQ
jgi:hypothetical protein